MYTLTLHLDSDSDKIHSRHRTYAAAYNRAQWAMRGDNSNVQYCTIEHDGVVSVVSRRAA